MNRDGRARAIGAVVALGLAALAPACAPQRQPVVPRAAFVMREAHRDAIEGRDTTLARIVYPEFVAARTPEALDSLRAMVHALAVAPAGARTRPAGSIATLLDNFIADWNAERQVRRLHEYWRFERRIEVASDTLGAITMVVTERTSTGGAPRITRREVQVGVDDGRTIRFGDPTSPGAPPPAVRDSASTRDSSAAPAPPAPAGG